MQVNVEKFVWNAGVNLKDLRNTEKVVSYEGKSIAVHDIRSRTRLAAILNIVTTIVVCLILASGTLLL